MTPITLSMAISSNIQSYPKPCQARGQPSKNVTYSVVDIHYVAHMADAGFSHHTYGRIMLVIVYE
jgi:hypothetical protein